MTNNLHEVVQLIENHWAGKRALVIGDVMLDRYIWGEVERISPEAPVPVVISRQQTDRAGGAANVAMNVAGLGAQVTLIGFQGQDTEGDCLEKILSEHEVETRMIGLAGLPTTFKLRILGGNQQMLRLDRECTAGYPESAYNGLMQGIKGVIDHADVVILSDYAKGVLTEDICQHAIGLARLRGIPVLVDPKHRNFQRYRGATTVCPNLLELALATGLSKTELMNHLEVVRSLIRDCDLESVTVTLSEKGIAVITEQDEVLSPAVAQQVFDVSGAGDSVLATLALSYACGLSAASAIHLANLAAAIVVGKVGTVPVTRAELLNSLMPEIELDAEEKVLSLERLRNRVDSWREAGNRIVFTNGCFDLLHLGHITLLENARRQGDRLIVAINSDASVRRLKGPSRPIVEEQQRARVLAALGAVDAVVIFDEPTPLESIIALKPDVVVKGGDYTEATVVGASEVRSWGGRVVLVPTVEGFSTTNLIAKSTGTT